jgi:hypothetical protein
MPTSGNHGTGTPCEDEIDIPGMESTVATHVVATQPRWRRGGDGLGLPMHAHGDNFHHNKTVIGWMPASNSERTGRKFLSAPKPTVEGDVLLLDPKTKFLSLSCQRSTVFSLQADIGLRR